MSEEIYLIVHASEAERVSKKPESENKNIRAVLIACASAYCGMNPKATNPDVWTTCVKMIREDFGFLSTAEIETAFRLCASGKISLDIKAYFGKFTAVSLGEILNAYSKKIHAPVLIEIREAIIRQKYESEKAERDRKNKETEARWTDLYNSSEYWETIKTPEELPSYMAEFFYRELMPKLSDPDKQLIYNQALASVIKSVTSELQNAKYQNSLEIEGIKMRLENLTKNGQSLEVKKELAPVFFQYAVFNFKKINQEEKL